MSRSFDSSYKHSDLREPKNHETPLGAANGKIFFFHLSICHCEKNIIGFLLNLA